MKHFFLIDPLEKLVLKKDSTLLMAKSFQDEGAEVHLLFTEDFYVHNLENCPHSFSVHGFSANFQEGSFYLQDFILEKGRRVEAAPGDCFHMRPDPPFDTRYLRFLWMLLFLEERGIKVLNSPKGILLHNEKLTAYGSGTKSIPSYVGGSGEEFRRFLEQLVLVKDHQTTSIILKPLDMYQGLGVEKWELFIQNKLDPSLVKRFEEKVRANNGPIVAQPFLSKVYSGEIRSIFYGGVELGSILKTPPEGKFLANIAQGASYKSYSLDESITNDCLSVCNRLLVDGVSFVAFDILGDFLSEVNITCPGLLVEVSNAHGRNLATEIFKREFR